MWQGYKNFDHYFEVSQLNDFLNEIKTPELVKAGRSHNYYNIPAGADIEVSSFYKDNKKYACMYLWGICIDGSSIYGRTWAELSHVLIKLKERFNIDCRNRLIVYVHNLGYEFQFIRKRFNWVKVFSIKNRRPVYALSTLGVEFRCSYFLSNFSLAYIGDNLLVNYPVKKAVGDLDYYKIRHYLTPVTKTEVGYQICDAQVVCAYIQEKIESDGGIQNIPLTNTGYVRNYCRNSCFGAGFENSKKVLAEYRTLMKKLQITSEQEYDQLKAAFAGGFTHASPLHSGRVLKNVTSIDRTSAYPFEMLSKKFPMSKGTYLGTISEEDAKFFMRYYCCLFTIRLWGISSIFEPDNYISISRCSKKSEDFIDQNGRLVEASYVQLTITEQDFEIIDRTYEWDKIEFCSFRIYERGYLPKDLIMAVLHFYNGKTSLKDVADKVVEYMVLKNMLNASYGMMVTSIIRDENVYENDEWETIKADVVSQLTDYNQNFQRFLFYAWGVWVTAYARNSLWKGILEFGEDYVYADTDSIKALNFSNHEDWVEIANFNCQTAISNMCRHYNIPISYAVPKTKKGVPKHLGVWENEGTYVTFKTIGAKRYMYEYDDGHMTFTVSGLNKNVAMPYLLWEYSNISQLIPREEVELAYCQDSRRREESKVAMNKICEFRKSGVLDYSLIFNKFKDGLYIPKGYTGKLTMTYLDEPFQVECTDYLGQTVTISELSAIHAEPQDYWLSQHEAYLRFIEDIQDGSL